MLLEDGTVVSGVEKVAGKGGWVVRGAGDVLVPDLDASYVPEQFVKCCQAAH